MATYIVSYFIVVYIYLIYLALYGPYDQLATSSKACSYIYTVAIQLVEVMIFVVFQIANHAASVLASQLYIAVIASYIQLAMQIIVIIIVIVIFIIKQLAIPYIFPFCIQLCIDILSALHNYTYTVYIKLHPPHNSLLSAVFIILC